MAKAELIVKNRKKPVHRAIGGRGIGKVNGKPKVVVRSYSGQLPMTADRWWGEVCYGGNDDTIYSYHEIAVGSDDGYAVDHVVWDSSNSFLYDSDLEFRLPNADGLVYLYVDDSHEPTNPPGAAIDLVGVQVHVGVDFPAKVRLQNLIATFYHPTRAPYVMNNTTGVQVDCRTGPCTPKTNSLWLYPYINGVTFSGVRVVANIYMEFDPANGTPPPNGLWARIEAVRA